MKRFPEIGEIIKKKEEHRRALAALSFEKKIEIVFKLQERARFMKSGRAVTGSRYQRRKSA